MGGALFAVLVSANAGLWAAEASPQACGEALWRIAKWKSKWQMKVSEGTSKNAAACRQAEREATAARPDEAGACVGVVTADLSREDRDLIMSAGDDSGPCFNEPRLAADAYRSFVDLTQTMMRMKCENRERYEEMERRARANPEPPRNDGPLILGQGFNPAPSRPRERCEHEIVPAIVEVVAPTLPP